MKITTKSRYAIRAIFALNALGGEHTPVGLAKIAEREHISKKYLEQIFMRLKELDIVAGSRGAGGGYTFLRKPSEITLKEVVHAMDGPQMPFDCNSEETCSRYESCGINWFWEGLKKTVDTYLDKITVEDLKNGGKDVDLF